MREPREFTDFSDYPQDGFGNLDCEREIFEPRYIPEEKEEEEPDEDYPDELEAKVTIQNNGNWVSQNNEK